MRRVFLIFLIFFLFISPAGAVEEISQDTVKSFSFSVNGSEGIFITGFDANNIGPNFNYSATFDNYGYIYQLDIISSKSWGWWDFDVSLTNPNGTVETQHLKEFAPVIQCCDIHFQHALSNTDMLEFTDVDIYTGFIPLTASFTNPISSDSDLADILPDEYSYERLAFSEVIFCCTNYADVIAYVSTYEEFEAQKQESISAYANELLSDVFSWTWDHIISFVEKIPGIGPQFATALIISTFIISEIFFYFNLLFIEYIETTILTIEFFIMTYTIRMTRARDPIRYALLLVKNTVQNHITIVEFIIDKSTLAVTLVMRIISAVAGAINAIKP